MLSRDDVVHTLLSVFWSLPHTLTRWTPHPCNYIHTAFRIYSSSTRHDIDKEPTRPATAARTWAGSYMTMPDARNRGSSPRSSDK
jgi:hypothetical protein